ncbi:hypothetical protein [Pseudomonas aeruginosa]|uniref:hypothetical protein n=2 Tax=Pseudomonas aeruginosa TaxID=287 RepID=UPI0012904B98|nr:hypothetical protein [Pseudomonas aeruginosa]HCE9893675.1 hypothetical protein [Pseudomonas aeruginosa]
MMRIAFLLCLCLLTTGCSNFSKEPKWPWADGVPCSRPSTGSSAGAATDPRTCDISDVVETYNKAQRYCIDYANAYEDGGDAINSSRFWIATVGTLSGAVFAPIAGGSAKDAWSGLSGSTNALQSALNESFSNAINVRRRSEIASAGTTARQQVANSADNLIKVLAAMDIAYDCKMAVGRADAEVVRALNELQKSGTAAGEKPVAAVKPVETKADAQAKASDAASEAAESAAAIPVTSGATTAEQKTIEVARKTIANAAADAAATAAATAATQTVQQASAVSGTAPTLLQTQAAAQVAAQIAAENAAQATIERKTAELLQGEKRPRVRQALSESAGPTASAAAEAAASAAAAAAAAPVQPIDVR